MASQFEALLSSFAESKGLQAGNTAAGIEFATDDQSLVVVPHPTRDDLLIVEVQVADFGPEAESLSRGALLLLHQINESARFEHEWVASISAEGAVQIHCVRLISSTDLPTLEALMGEGLERAESLAELIGSFGQSQEGAGQNESSPQLPGQLGGPFLRA